MKYLVYGFEKGESGTPHLQGFVQFKNPIEKPSKFFGPAYHFEPMRGTFEEAIEYTKKDGEYQEFGQMPLSPSENGALGGECEKKRYADAFEAAKAGDFDSIPADLMTRHYNTYKKIRFDFAEPAVANDELNNYWIYGPAGTGKSRSVREFFGDSLYVKNPNKWFDGYDGEKFILIDDVHPDWVGKTALKIWADHYPFSPEVKGGHFKLIRPEGVIVTSNYSIEQCFPHQEDLEPMRRRFKVIKSEACYDVIMKSYKKRVIHDTILNVI